jgi:hypothetical protein
LFEQRRHLRNCNDEKAAKSWRKLKTNLQTCVPKLTMKKLRRKLNISSMMKEVFNSGHLWRLIKKLSPKCKDPLTAMLDQKGNLITSAKARSTCCRNLQK